MMPNFALKQCLPMYFTLFFFQFTTHLLAPFGVPGLQIYHHLGLQHFTTVHAFLYILTFSIPLLWCFLSPRRGDRDAPFMAEHSVAKYSQYLDQSMQLLPPVVGRGVLWSRQTVVLIYEAKHSCLQGNLTDTSCQFSKTIALTPFLGTMTYQVMWKGLSSWI